MKPIVIKTETFTNRLRCTKNYIYTLLCAVFKNLLSWNNYQTTFYNNGFGIAPSGYEWGTELRLLGLKFKIVKRSVHWNNCT